MVFLIEAGEHRGDHLIKLLLSSDIPVFAAFLIAFEEIEFLIFINCIDFTGDEAVLRHIQVDLEFRFRRKIGFRAEADRMNLFLFRRNHRALQESADIILSKKELLLPADEILQADAVSGMIRQRRTENLLFFRCYEIEIPESGEDQIVFPRQRIAVFRLLKREPELRIPVYQGPDGFRVRAAFRFAYEQLHVPDRFHEGVYLVFRNQIAAFDIGRITIPVIFRVAGQKFLIQEIDQRLTLRDKRFDGGKEIQFLAIADLSMICHCGR